MPDHRGSAVAPYLHSRPRDLRVTKTLRILNPVPQRTLETVSFTFPPAKTALSTLSNDILCPENDCDFAVHLGYYIVCAAQAVGGAALQ